MPHRRRQHELWLERERRSQAEFEARKLWEEKERQKREEEEVRKLMPVVAIVDPTVKDRYCNFGDVDFGKSPNVI